MNVLDATRSLPTPNRPRVILVGSGVSYGNPAPEHLPVSETCPLRPNNPYAASKAAADLAGIQYALAGWADVVVVRPFNHAGPGQSPRYALADFARQVVEVESGRLSRIEVGNLDVVRDFSDVRDVVAAYVAARDRGRRGEVYNVCSGVGHSIREMLSVLIELSGCAVEVAVAPERSRAVDVPQVIGSSEKLRRDTGWQPRIEWRQMLADVYDAWRS